MSYGIYLLNIKALQISYGSFFRKLLTKPKWRKCPICSDTGYIAGTEQRAESNAGKERNAARQQSRGGARSIDSIAKQVVKYFCLFLSVMKTFRAVWFGHVAYTAVGYQCVTVSHFSPSTNTPSLYSQLFLTAQKSILWRILQLGLKAHLWVTTGSQLGMEKVWNDNTTVCSTEGLQGSSWSPAKPGGTDVSKRCLAV